MCIFSRFRGAGHSPGPARLRAGAGAGGSGPGRTFRLQGSLGLAEPWARAEPEPAGEIHPPEESPQVPCVPRPASPGPRPARRRRGPHDLSRGQRESEVPGSEWQAQGGAGGAGSPRGGAGEALKSAHPARPTQSAPSTRTALAAAAPTRIAMPKCPKCAKEVYFGEREPRGSAAQRRRAGRELGALRWARGAGTPGRRPGNETVAPEPCARPSARSRFAAPSSTRLPPTMGGSP